MNETSNEQGGGSGASTLFGAMAAAYARHRLTYTSALFDLLLQRLPASPLLWDCGCGSGPAPPPDRLPPGNR
jgi:hypothetical protein